MYLAYVDESEDEHNFVLPAVACNEHQVLRISEALDQVESQYFGVLPPAERPVLLHCTTIRNPNALLARGKPKAKDRQLALLIATWDQIKRNQLLDDVYQIINRQHPLVMVIFPIVIGTTAQAHPPHD